MEELEMVMEKTRFGSCVSAAEAFPSTTASQSPGGKNPAAKTKTAGNVKASQAIAGETSSGIPEAETCG
jgi:hypothetical protein